MNKTNAGGASRRRCDDAFMEEAVRAWKSSGKSAEQVARELELRAELLYKWHGGP